MELVCADAEFLLEGVRGTANMAAHISSRIKRLDLARTNAEATLETVDLILNRTNCIHGVQVRSGPRLIFKIRFRLTK